ncbi:hypothetical protein [Allosediminivita pacifica]|nr:hypothetical protein [Allosediminivita pacifica]
MEAEAFFVRRQKEVRGAQIWLGSRKSGIIFIMITEVCVAVLNVSEACRATTVNIGRLPRIDNLSAVAAV